LKLKKISREAAKARRDFGFGRAEGAGMRIKMKIMEISSEMEDRRPQPQHAGGWAAPRLDGCPLPRGDS